ncbi:MAG: SGNH/GDSL hydrolase family protein [Bacillota bacterium]|nr:SGNH/GDSL hydrolase family protein [Bacillota bacterium]
MILKHQEILLFTGDSVTDCGRGRPHGYGLGGLGEGYPRLIYSLLQLAYTDRDIAVVNTGISGDTTAHILARMDEDILAIKPHVLSIMIGINDVWRHYDTPALGGIHIDVDQYRRNYTEIIERSLAMPQLRRMLLLTPFFLDQSAQDPMRRQTEAYADVVRELARQDERLCLVDIAAAFDKLTAQRHYMQLASDRVHPNPTAHLFIAQEVMAALE